MDKQSQAVFERILAKAIVSLTEHDIKFLKARRDYLNETQLGFYSVLFDGKPSTYASDDYSKIQPEVVLPTYKELQARARELGLKVRVGLKREVLQEMITQAEL